MHEIVYLGQTHFMIAVVKISRYRKKEVYPMIKLLDDSDWLMVNKVATDIFA